MEIQETLLKLLLKAPFYGYIASKLTIRESFDIKKIRITVYPVLVLTYNPQWFRDLSSDQKIGAVLHELMHIILLHPFRRGDRKPSLWAVAGDMAVNQYVDKKYLNDDSVTIDIIAKEFKIRIPYYQSSEFYYSILEKFESRLTLGGSEQEALIILESDKEMKTDIIEDQDVSSSNLSAIKSEIVTSMENSGAENEMPGELKKTLDQVYHEYKVNWKSVLKRFLSKRGKINKRKSYKRISRRYENLPGTIKTKGVEALVALDESGSMSDELIKIYLKELKEINKITGVNIQVVRFDSSCSEPVPLRQYIEEEGRERRGGTDFRPIFKLADNIKIPLVIIFTDGEGDAPESVNQRVLWLLTKGGRKPASFGESVYFTN